MKLPTKSWLQQPCYYNMKHCPRQELPEIKYHNEKTDKDLTVTENMLMTDIQSTWGKGDRTGERNR